MRANICTPLFFCRNKHPTQRRIRAPAEYCRFEAGNEQQKTSTLRWHQGLPWRSDWVPHASECSELSELGASHALGSPKFEAIRVPQRPSAALWTSVISGLRRFSFGLRRQTRARPKCQACGASLLLALTSRSLTRRACLVSEANLQQICLLLCSRSAYMNWAASVCFLLPSGCCSSGCVS